MTGSHVFTMRTNRLVSIVSFVVSVFIVLAVASLFGLLGAVEFVIALVIAIPMTILLSRWLRTVVERRSQPA